VTFAPAPQERVEAAALDLWAVRATLGARHASQTGRLPATGSALALALPADVGAGSMAGLRQAPQWRRAAAPLLGEAAPAPMAPAGEGRVRSASPLWALDAPTSARARPATFVAGGRLLLGARHYAPAKPSPRAAAAVWASNGPRPGALAAPAPALLPTLGHLSGALAQGRALAPRLPLLEGLALLRGGAAQAPTQHLL
jgi:hypothetical protein